MCIAALSGVLALQFLWIGNYYQVNRDRFEKDVNLAFEDAVKTEFRLRCDTLEDVMFRFVMDTSQIAISSKWNSNIEAYVYTIADKNNLRDEHSFSHKLINLPVVSTLDSVTRQVARFYARSYRKEDFERHVIYFDTQNIGKYIGEQVEHYKFDTARLRPIYTRSLKERGIEEPFAFHLRHEDSTINRSLFSSSLQQLYPVITKSFPTYKLSQGENYVRAMFQKPVGYLYRKMTGIVLASGLLLGIVAFALYYLTHIISRQKKLADIKNDFIGNISHEFKTPIATVAAAVEAMDSFGALESPAKAKRYLEISRNELQRLASMVNKILDFSIHENHDTVLKLELINVDEMINELTGKCLMFDDKDISFHYCNDAGSNPVLADKLHLHNALSNLIENAVKYSGKSVIIDIHFYRDKNHNVISVKDNGIGISSHDLPLIFDKFYRVPSGNIHSVKGYGLGLSYVKYMMEKQGGWCSVESKKGSGSIFRLGLPVT